MRHWDALGRGVPAHPDPAATPDPPTASPGVIETVPLAGDGALAVGGVVSPHGGARVVGDGVKVVNGVVCGEQGQYSAVLAAAPLPPNIPAQSWGQEGLAHWMSAAPTPCASAPPPQAAAPCGA